MQFSSVGSNYLVANLCLIKASNVLVNKELKLLYPDDLDEI
jgi:hypothetical protein